MANHMGEYEKEDATPVLAGLSYGTLLLAGTVILVLGLLERNPARAATGLMMFLPGAGATAYLVKNGERVYE